MTARRGTVWIAPVDEVPSGTMVDPEVGRFFVSWQDWDEEAELGVFLEDGGEIEGAVAALEWARSRADRVLIRLAHTAGSYFSAGRIPETVHDDGRPLPEWPPTPPSAGWWIPKADRGD